jgi:hypothetical protein
MVEAMLLEESDRETERMLKKRARQRSIIALLERESDRGIRKLD